jgi:hypothetical protein
MTRLEALKELKEKVEANNIDALPDNCFRHAFAGMKTAGIAFIVSEAHEGSLDACLALHEAVLPGWKHETWGGYAGGAGGAAVYQSVLSSTKEQSPAGPARAWLIAILSALIAQEESQ